MKKMFVFLGWIGIVIVELLNLGNPDPLERNKPSQHSLVIIGLLTFVAILLVGTAVTVSVLTYVPPA